MQRLKRMEVATTWSANDANLTSAGSALGHGNHTARLGGYFIILFFTRLYRALKTSL